MIIYYMNLLPKRYLVKHPVWFVLFFLSVLTSCGTTFDEEEPQLVVEGWIEDGNFPKVKLTYTVPISDKYQDLSNLNQYVEKWAKVSVDDGEHKVILLGHYDDKEFPQYVYTTSEMRGKAGKTYRLIVDCPNGMHAEAITTIPNKVEIDRFETEPIGDQKEMFQLYGYISPSGLSTNDCYKIFSFVHGKPYGFRSAYMGLVSAENLGDKRRVALNNGSSNMEDKFYPYFFANEIISIKLAHLNEEGYLFWRDFEDLINLSRNPLFPITKNLHSNVKGGLGYWFGYGSSVYTLKIYRSGSIKIIDSW